MDSRECAERTWRDWACRHGLDAERVVHAAHAGMRAIGVMGAYHRDALANAVAVVASAGHLVLQTTSDHLLFTLDVSNV